MPWMRCPLAVTWILDLPRSFWAAVEFDSSLPIEGTKGPMVSAEACTP